jgi:hypothetical protein
VAGSRGDHPHAGSMVVAWDGWVGKGALTINEPVALRSLVASKDRVPNREDC